MTSGQADKDDVGLWERVETRDLGPNWLGWVSDCLGKGLGEIGW